MAGKVEKSLTGMDSKGEFWEENSTGEKNFKGATVRNTKAWGEQRGE